MSVTFRDLHDRLTARGITVGVDVDRRGHAIVLEDPDSLRAARMRVPDAGFDRAATKLVVSARLQELLCGGCDWPELTRQ
jgi:hypothetical protein